MNTKNACLHKPHWAQIKKLCLRIAALLIVTILLSQISQAQETPDKTLRLTDQSPGSFNLSKHVKIYEPGLQSPDLDTITQLDDRQWQSTKTLTISDVARGRHTSWYKLELVNHSSSEQKLVLSNGSPFSETMNVYSCNTNLDNCKKIEDQYSNSIYEITAKKNNEITLLIQCTGHGSILSGVLFQTHKYYKDYIYKLSYFSALIIGSILALVIYTFLLGLTTKQHMYYSYCILGVCNIAAVITYQKLPLSILQFQHTELTADLAMTLTSLSLPATIQFILVFTNAFQLHKKLYHFLTACAGAALLITFSFAAEAPVIIIFPLFILTGAISYCALLYLCAISSNQTPITRYILSAGIIMPTLSGFIASILASGAIESNFDDMQVTYGLTAISMILYSIAMLSSVNNLKKQHDNQVESTVRELAVNEAHNRLLAHLNHEFRTPLNGILGASEILIHKSNPRDRDMFSMIYQTALPLKDLIEKMVNSSLEMESSETLSQSRFDLKTLLQECTDIFTLTARQKNIRIFFSSEHNVTNDVTGDQNKIRQILLNFIGNACKFTENGFVCLHVSQEMNNDNNKTTYRFEVIDSGVGIDEQQQRKLFHAFETSVSSANPSGTGLGLSIAMKLARTIGGDCGYQPNPTKGSTFWLTAPLQPHKSIKRQPHSVFENMNILIVDECEALCKSLANYISLNNEKITSASTYTSLIALTKTKTFDIIVAHANSKILIDLLNGVSSEIIFYYDLIDNRDDCNIINFENTIIRKTSIESFSLKIAEEIISRAKPVSANIETSNKSKTKRILIAEDIIANQHIIQEIIRSLGLKAEVCSNGKKALDIFKNHQLLGEPFSAIIMDCEMPIMDGFESARLIRAYELSYGIAKTPIIALTAHSENSYRERSTKAGMDAFLTKPITTERIIQCLTDQGCI